MTSPLNSPKDNSLFRCYSPETRCIFAKMLILLIYWRKHGNGSSKLSGFFLC